MRRTRSFAAFFITLLSLAVVVPALGSAPVHVRGGVYHGRFHHSMGRRWGNREGSARIVVHTSANVGEPEAYLASWRVSYPTECINYGVWGLEQGEVGDEGRWRIPEDGRLTLRLDRDTAIHLSFSGQRVEGTLATQKQGNCERSLVKFDIPHEHVAG